MGRVVPGIAERCLHLRGQQLLWIHLGLGPKELWKTLKGSLVEQSARMEAPAGLINWGGHRRVP